jgi:hypothetical protein
MCACAARAVAEGVVDRPNVYLSAALCVPERPPVAVTQTNFKIMPLCGAADHGLATAVGELFMQQG